MGHYGQDLLGICPFCKPAHLFRIASWVLCRGAACRPSHPLPGPLPTVDCSEDNSLPSSSVGRGRKRRSGELKMNKEALALCRGEDQRNGQNRCGMENAFRKKFVFARYEEIHPACLFPLSWQEVSILFDQEREGLA